MTSQVASRFKSTCMFFSFDCETDGPDHNMLEGGLVAFDHTGKEVGVYRFAMTPQGPSDPNTLKWLTSTMIGNISVYENALQGAIDPYIAMRDATCWCMDTLLQHNATTGYLLCFPSAFDGRYWTNYCERYNLDGYDNFLARFPKARTDPTKRLYRDPFGFNHIDGQSFAMGLLTERANLKTLRSYYFSPEESSSFEKIAHDAVQDARNQGQLFFRIAETFQKR